MDEKEKKPGGFTVSELEEKMRKFGIEATLCAAFILSAIFALVWGGKMMVWSILLAAVGGIVGVFLPKAIYRGVDTVLQFFIKERVTSIIVAVLIVVISIFLPLLTFALVGLIAGETLVLAGYRAWGHDLLGE